MSLLLIQATVMIMTMAFREDLIFLDQLQKLTSSQMQTQEENHFLFMDKLHFMLATHLELFQDFDIQKIPLQPM